MIALTESRGLTQTWRDCYFWSFPFYVVGASIAWLLCLVSQTFNWLGSLLLMKYRIAKRRARSSRSA